MRDTLLAEKQRLQTWLPQCFGRHLLMLSDDLQMADLAGSQIRHKIISHRQLKTNTQLVLDSCDLPFANDSLDLLILHHQLEHSANPRQTLIETERVLISHGQAILLGLRLHRTFSVKRYVQPTTDKHTYTLSQLKALLAETSLAIEAMCRIHYKTVGFWERLKNVLWSETLYAIRIRKKTLGMMPLINKKSLYAQTKPCPSNSFNNVLAPRRKQEGLGQLSPKTEAANNQ